MLVRTEINRTVRELNVDPMRRLIDVLRDDLGLIGTKESCAVGVCGACSVLVDGDLVSACLAPMGLLNGRSVTTIEGLSDPAGALTPLQDAFIREGGLQCGACTPGQIVAATALLAETPAPSEPEIRDWMAGNLCRCTGYTSIVRAIKAAAGVLREGAAGSAVATRAGTAAGPGTGS